MPSKRIPVTRAPRGVLSDKPVYMRLMPDERRALERLAAEQNRSTSSVARMVYIAGYELFTNKPTGRRAQSHAKSVAGR